MKTTFYSVSEALRTANQNALDTIVPDVLPAAAELANSRLSKVVMVRSDQHASLPLKEFLIVFNEGWSFIIKCEVMARKMIVGLRGVMMSQVLLQLDRMKYRLSRRVVSIGISTICLLFAAA